MTDILQAIMDAYRRVEARKVIERRTLAADRAQNEQDRRRYRRRIDG